MISLGASRDPTGKLDPQPWLVAPETKAVVAALSADRAEVRFVGGCVRDALARRPVKDVDIATTDRPERVVELLEAAGLKAVPTGIDHGTVTAVSGGRGFEVTTLRVDVDTDGRRATVAFTDDWIADAARRDFTINALSATPDGDVYDYFDGIADLAHGRVRFVGRAEERVVEDYLRILRFFRFYAHYGRPPVDPDALQACRRHAGMLPSLSGERVRDELLKTLSCHDPAEIVLMMRAVGVLAEVLPEAGDPGRLRAAAWIEERAVRVEGLAPDPLRRLGALIAGGEAGAATEVAGRLRLSNSQTDRLAGMCEPAFAPSAGMSERELRRALHGMGAATVRDAAVLAWAGELAIRPKLPHAETEGWIRVLEAAAAWSGIEFPVKGRDVLALGVAPGRRVGSLLAAVEAWWEDGDFRAGRDACLDRLRETIENETKGTDG